MASTGTAAARKPRLFLSHSSKDAQLTDAVAKALAEPLGEHPGFDVLFDKECLAAGEEWPIQLHAMMAYAQSGLLLLTPEAMKRPDWILKEAYILTWRRSLDSGFKVFYALLDGVQIGELTEKGFGPTHLDMIQKLVSTDPQAIANEVKQSGPPPLDVSTPFEELTLKLSSHLGGLNAAALELVATRLGAPAVPWQPAAMPPYIGRIAARILAGEFGAYRTLLELVNELRGLNVPPPSLENVLRWVAPYWLSPVASGRLAAVVHELWQRKVDGWAAVNGQHLVPYTATMFMHRVLPFAFQCRVARIESATNRADADYYTHAICEWVRDHDDDGLYPEDDDEIIAQLRDDEVGSPGTELEFAL